MLNIHVDIKSTLNKFIETNKIPNIIFHGESGSGKKTILNEFLDNIYTNIDNKDQYIMYVNCAHGKGIKFIRDELKFFAKTNINTNSGTLIKSIVLLNSEKLTIDAQSALRRCIELFSNNTRFFIIVEDKEKLLKPIISRFCTVYIPRPMIDGKIVNLHHLRRINPPKNLYSTKTNLIAKTFHTLNKPDKSNKGNNIFNMALKLYEKGCSGLDLIQYINEHLEDSSKKFEMLIYFNNIKYEIRNEKLLMFQILNIYTMRNDFSLENINTM
jgi:DNA polymerase III delta prime subunit